MNFEELKNKMSGESEGFHIPETNLNLRKSRLPIEEVRKSMKSEIITQLGFILIFFSVIFIVELYPLAFSVYVTMMTLACTITIMYLVRMFRFVKKTDHIDGNSKSSIEYFVNELRLTMEVYKTAVIGSSLLLPLPVLALFFGNTKSSSPELFSSYFLLEGNANTTILIVAGLLIVGVVIYFITIWWAEALYGKHIQNLEELLNDLV